MDQIIKWHKEKVILLDQRKLPAKVKNLTCKTVEQLALAIESLAVRGAPLIGITGAYGLVLGIWNSSAKNIENDFDKAYKRIKRTRPTAVNLFWALEKMEAVFYDLLDRNMAVSQIKSKMLRAASEIHRQDAEVCRLIGINGAKLIKRPSNIITHCNTGVLATGGMGTALGIILTAYKKGTVKSVLIDETRPLLQGARLTAWELAKNKIPSALICDNMAASLMASGKIDCAIVGADRICANGDVANKIGTYGLAVNAYYHGIPFYVASPISTFDISLQSGKAIPIEQRGEGEVKAFGNCRIAPEKIKALNPAFDVTPAKLISAIITERGVLFPPFGASIKRLLR